MRTENHIKGHMEMQDIVLRKGVFDDWRDLLQNILSRDESAEYMLWNPIYDEEHARENAKKMVEFQLTHDAWVVYEKKSDQAIGWTGVKEIDKKVWQDTGIAIGPDFTGKGYGKQVLQCMMYYVFEEKKADKMLCSCRSKNTASKALIRGSGFVFSTFEDKIDPRNGEKYMLEYYEMSRII